MTQTFEEAGMEELLNKGRRSGHVSAAEVLVAIPEAEGNRERLSSIVSQLSENGIAVRIDNDIDRGAGADFIAGFGGGQRTLVGDHSLFERAHAADTGLHREVGFTRLQSGAAALLFQALFGLRVQKRGAAFGRLHRAALIDVPI